MKKGLKQILSALICAVVLLSLFILAASAEELLLHDPMENYKKMADYSANLIYADYNEEQPHFPQEFWNRPAVMAFGDAGPEDSFMIYDITGATRVEASALLASPDEPHRVGGPPNHLKFMLSADKKSWKSSDAVGKLFVEVPEEKPGVWTAAYYKLTNIPAKMKYVKIILYIPEGMPRYCSRVYSVDIYGNKPAAVSSTPAKVSSTLEVSSVPTESSEMVSSGEGLNNGSDTSSDVSSVVSNNTSDGAASVPLWVFIVCLLAVTLVESGVCVLILYKKSTLFTKK